MHPRSVFLCKQLCSRVLDRDFLIVWCPVIVGSLDDWNSKGLVKSASLQGKFTMTCFGENKWFDGSDKWFAKKHESSARLKYPTSRDLGEVNLLRVRGQRHRVALDKQIGFPSSRIIVTLATRIFRLWGSRSDGELINAGMECKSSLCLTALTCLRWVRQCSSFHAFLQTCALVRRL